VYAFKGSTRIVDPGPPSFQMRRLWRLWVWRHRVTWRHRWRQSTRRGHFLIGSLFFTRTPKSLQFPRYLVKVADKQTRRLNCVRLSLRQQVVVAVFRLSQPATWSYTTLQTVNLRHPCVQCRWSSLPECLSDYLKSSDLSFDVFKHHQLKTFLFCRYCH